MNWAPSSCFWTRKHRVQYNQGSMDPKYNTWFLHQFFLYSAPDTLSPSSPRPINDKGTGYDIRGDSLLTGKISHNVPSSSTGPRFLQQCFCGPKEGWGWRPFINLQKLNNYIHCLHFKMENIFSLRDILKKGDWLAKIDLKDAYLDSPHGRGTSEISLISVAREDLQVQVPSIWSGLSSTGIHQVSACGSVPLGTGCATSDLLR